MKNEEPVYIEKGRLNQICWVRSLRALELIDHDPEVSGAAMVYGTQDDHGHAWITYKKRGHVFTYDPSRTCFIGLKPCKPHTPIKIFLLQNLIRLKCLLEKLPI